jgi:hypothetical protein
MTPIASISLSEYLNTSYNPDREYLNGELRERNAGKWEHARIQFLLAAWFYQHEKEWGITGSTEQRIQATPEHVSVAYVVVMTAGPQPDVLVDPPCW